MSEVRARAVALARLIEATSRGSISPPIIESLLDCCGELLSAGEPNLALDILGRAAAVGSTKGDESGIRLKVIRARALAMAGRSQEALDEVRWILRTARQSLSGSRQLDWQLRILEADALWHLGRVEESVDSLLNLRLELLSVPDSYELASCAHHLQCAYLVRGEYDKARVFGLESLVSARRSRSRYLEALALDNLSRIDRALCRWAAAQEASESARRLFEEESNRIGLNHCLRGLAVTAFKQGKLDEAEKLSSRAMRDASALGIELLSSYLVLQNGLILLHKGNVAEAKECFDKIGDVELDSMNPRLHLLSVEYVGDTFLESGDASAALLRYEEAWPKAMALVPKGDVVAELRRRRAECFYLLGRVQEAYAESKAALIHCRELGDRYEEAATYRVLSLSAGAVGRHAEAKEHFEQGFAYYDDIETPYEWGKLWMAFGDWLSGSHAGPFGDTAAACEAFAAAHDLFNRMGAKAKSREAQERLDRVSAQTARLEHDPNMIPSGHHIVGSKPLPPRRRPRASTELERRSAWAWERFGLVTRHRGVLTLLTKAEKLAPSRAAVLVLGESGTGKELIAHGLHRLSGRAGSWKPINCSTLPREVIESELFGHEAGAFTGAVKRKPGLLEVCAGGTAFLDEVGEMPIELQSRLLRFLENGELRRVGGTDEIHSDARVVAATNRDRTALETGAGMRPDLYYRLAHAVIELPPLRRRGDDVELLIDHFLKDACKTDGKTATLSSDARARLLSYGWPGNVRQLKVAMRRLVLFAEDGAEVQANEIELERGSAPATLAEELAVAERRQIDSALEASRGSKTEAAKALGMPRTTLLHKMKRLGMVKDEQS